MAASNLILILCILGAIFVNELEATGEVVVCSNTAPPTCSSSIYNMYQNFPTTEEQITPFCSDVRALCNDTLTSCDCASEETMYQCLDFLGLKDAMLYLCDNTELYKTVYLSNVQCIASNMETLVTSCRSDQEETCSGYNAAGRCFYDGMKTACSTDVANMMSQFQLKRFGHLLGYINCDIELKDVVCAVDNVAPILCSLRINNMYQLYPTTEDQLMPFCSDVWALCNDTLTSCDCASEDTMYQCLDFLGLKNAILYLCYNPDLYKTVYLNNLQCIVDNMETLVSSCRKEQEETCTGYNTAARCFYDGMKKACNADVAKMTSQFQLKRFRPLLGYIKCDIELSDVCTNTATGQCSSSIYNMYQHFPVSEAEFTPFCSHVRALCSDTLTSCDCASEDTMYQCLDFLGLKDAILDLCDNTELYKTVYLNNLQCIASNVETLMSSCRSDQQQTCSGYNAAARCYYYGMKRACNSDVANMMSHFQLKRFGPLLGYIDCDIGTSVYGASAAMSASIVLIAAAAALALFQLMSQ